MERLAYRRLGLYISQRPDPQCEWASVRKYSKWCLPQCMRSTRDGHEFRVIATQYFYDKIIYWHPVYRTLTSFASFSVFLLRQGLQILPFLSKVFPLPPHPSLEHLWVRIPPGTVSFFDFPPSAPRLGNQRPWYVQPRLCDGQCIIYLFVICLCGFDDVSPTPLEFGDDRLMTFYAQYPIL